MSKQTFNGKKEKRKHKEPLDLLQDVMYGNFPSGEQDQAYEDLKSYLKLHTPPTADEVCEEIEKTFGSIYEISYIPERETFRLTQTVLGSKSWYVLVKTKYKGSNLITFPYKTLLESLPPRLITMIGRFYEGLKE